MSPVQTVSAPAAVETLPEASSKPDFDRFKKFIPFVLEREEAFDKQGNVTWEDVPGDNGGVTKYGVDQASHPNVDIKNLTLDSAEKIYYQEWLGHKCNELPSPIAETAFDAFVTGGHPVKWLQEVLGVTADGFIGPNTISAAAASNHLATAEAMLVKRDAYFTSLANSVAHDKKFEAGWLNRDTKLKAFIKTLA